MPLSCSLFSILSCITASCRLSHLALSPIFCSFSSHPYVISCFFLSYLILSSHVFPCSHSSSLSHHLLQSFPLSSFLTSSCIHKLIYSCSLSAIIPCVFLFTSFFHFMGFSCSLLLLFHDFLLTNFCHLICLSCSLLLSFSGQPFLTSWHIISLLYSLAVLSWPFTYTFQPFREFIILCHLLTLFQYRVIPNKILLCKDVCKNIFRSSHEQNSNNTDYTVQLQGFTDFTYN